MRTRGQLSQYAPIRGILSLFLVTSDVLTNKHSQSHTHITQWFVLGLDAAAGRREPRSRSAAWFVFWDGQEGATQLPNRGSVSNRVDKYCIHQQSDVYLSEASFSPQRRLDQKVLLAWFTLHAGNSGATNQMDRQHTTECVTPTGTKGRSFIPAELSQHTHFACNNTLCCYSAHSHTAQQTRCLQDAQSQCGRTWCCYDSHTGTRQGTVETGVATLTGFST